MSDFADYLTPEQYKALPDNPDPRSVGELRVLAATGGSCMVCGRPVWRLAGVGLCFPCATGESDASRDYELIPEA